MLTDNIIREAMIKIYESFGYDETAKQLKGNFPLLPFELAFYNAGYEQAKKDIEELSQTD